MMGNVRKHFSAACLPDGTTAETTWQFAVYYGAQSGGPPASCPPSDWSLVFCAMVHAERSRLRTHSRSVPLEWWCTCGLSNRSMMTPSGSTVAPGTAALAC